MSTEKSQPVRLKRDTIKELEQLRSHERETMDDLAKKMIAKTKR